MLEACRATYNQLSKLSLVSWKCIKPLSSKKLSTNSDEEVDIAWSRNAKFRCARGSILVDAPNMDKAFGYEASLIVGHHSSCDSLTFESLVCCRFTEQIHCSSLDKDCTSRTGVETQDDKLLVLSAQTAKNLKDRMVADLFWFSFHYHCFALLFWAEFSSSARPLETSDFSRCNPFILIPLRLVKTKLSNINNSFCPSLCFHCDSRLLKGDTYPQCLEAQDALGKRDSDCFPLGSPAFWGVCCCSVYST